MKKIKKYSVGFLAGLVLIYAALIIIDAIPFKYKGDGKFVDYGISSTYQRYWLIFGDIDLSKKGRYEYSVGQLPQRELNFDIILNNNNTNYIDEISNTVIELIIKEDGIEAYRYKGKLFEDGHYNNKYYRKGLRQRLIKVKMRNDEKYLSWTLDDYDLMKSKYIFDRVKRTIIITVKKPAITALDVNAEIAIYGGSW